MESPQKSREREQDEDDLEDPDVKVIILGDRYGVLFCANCNCALVVKREPLRYLALSATGKSKLISRCVLCSLAGIAFQVIERVVRL
jgi:hypothetical protein